MEPARAAVRTLLTRFSGDTMNLYEREQLNEYTAALKRATVLLPLFCFDTFRRQNGKCITLKVSMRSTFRRQIVTPRGFPMHDRRFELEANANKQHIL